MKPEVFCVPETSPGSHRGMRSCAACRKRQEPGKLVRFFRLGDGVEIRLPGTRVSGRGFALCPKAFCFEKAGKLPRLAQRIGVSCFSGHELFLQTMQAYQERIKILRRSGSSHALNRIEPVFLQLSTELLNLPVSGSGETHVR